MRTKFISILILGICLLSIIVGLLSFNKPQKAEKLCPAPTKKAIFEKFSSGKDKIALISLQGVITYNTKSSFLGDLNSAEGALKALKKVIKDENVKGVIFRVNSPGGTVAMSQEIHNALLKLREKKPVVVSMADIAASGGYFVACAADRIYANPGSLTGSIGVIMETVNAKTLLTDKLGVESETIKSGRFKDTGSVYRPLRQDERTLLQNLVNNAYSQFLTAIEQGRIDRDDEYKVEKVELNKENLKKYADGRVFTGEQALQYGFIDHLGGLEQATEGVKKMAMEKFPFISSDIEVVNYNKPSDFSEFLFQISSSLNPGAQSFETLLPLSSRYPRQPLFIRE